MMKMVRLKLFRQNQKSAEEKSESNDVAYGVHDVSTKYRL